MLGQLDTPKHIEDRRHHTRSHRSHVQLLLSFSPSRGRRFPSGRVLIFGPQVSSFFSSCYVHIITPPISSTSQACGFHMPDEKNPASEGTEHHWQAIKGSAAEM